MGEGIKDLHNLDGGRIASHQCVVMPLIDALMEECMAKICITCKEVKELSEFVKSKNYSTGLSNKCKKCHAFYNKKYVRSRRKANAKPKEKIIIDKKYCDTCLIEKDINDYAACFSIKDGHRNKCKECYKISTKKRRYERINSYAHKEIIFCNECNKEKSYNEFANSGLSRVKPICKECWNTNYKLKRKSVSQICHLSHEDYNQLLEKQNFVCAICKKPETRILRGYPAKLVVDHCHESESRGINKIRGLLCSRCNSGLGWFKDSISSLKEAIKYLENQN